MTHLPPGGLGGPLLPDNPQPREIRLGLVRLALLVQRLVPILGRLRLGGLPLLPIRADAQLRHVVRHLGHRVARHVPRGLGVVRVREHIVRLVLVLVIGRREVADLDGHGLLARDGGLLAGLLLLLAVLAAQGPLVLVLRVGTRLLVGPGPGPGLGVAGLELGVFGPHADLVAVGVEGPEVAREVLAAWGCQQGFRYGGIRD